MKNNPSKKKAARKVKVAPIENTVAAHVEGIQQALEFFAKFKGVSPKELLAALFELFPAEEREGFAGFAWGTGLNFGVPLPDWAKLASEKAWRSVGVDVPHDFNGVRPETSGKVTEFIDLSFAENPPVLHKQDIRIAKIVINFAKWKSANLTAEDQSRYVKGRQAAPKILRNMKFPTEREQVFFEIASRWREVEKLGSRLKVFHWLKEQRGPKTGKLLLERTGWDEVKRWLAEINMPKGKPGRPKKNRYTC